jgi:hypothetical protein
LTGFDAVSFHRKIENHAPVSRKNSSRDNERRAVFCRDASAYSEPD